jgi:hypothetical protein
MKNGSTYNNMICSFLSIRYIISFLLEKLSLVLDWGMHSVWKKEEKFAKFIIITFAHCSTKCLFYASSYADLLPSQCYFLQEKSLRRLSIISAFKFLSSSLFYLSLLFPWRNQAVMQGREGESRSNNRRCEGKDSVLTIKIYKTSIPHFT